jgi:hypothetical protein
MFLCRLCVTKVGDLVSCAKCGSLCRVPEPEELAAALERQTQVFHKRTPSGPVALPGASGHTGR